MIIRGNKCSLQRPRCNEPRCNEFRGIVCESKESRVVKSVTHLYLDHTEYVLNKKKQF